MQQGHLTLKFSCEPLRAQLPNDCFVMAAGGEISNSPVRQLQRHVRRQGVSPLSGASKADGMPATLIGMAARVRP
jgi:hypothetical protein